MTKTNHLGEALRSMREGLSLTKSELAVKAGISPSEEAQIENGVKRPRASTLKKLSEALGVNPQELIKELEKDIEND